MPTGSALLRDCELLEVSVVHAGSQVTKITDIKAMKHGARNSAADLAVLQSAHDELVSLGAQCVAPRVGLDVPAPKGSRCSCGGTFEGPWRTVAAVKDGRTLGQLTWRPCGRCKMLLLDGNAQIRAADTGDGWARFVRRSEKSRADAEILESARFSTRSNPARVGDPAGSVQIEKLAHYNQVLASLGSER